MRAIYLVIYIFITTISLSFRPIKRSQLALYKLNFKIQNSKKNKNKSKDKPLPIAKPKNLKEKKKSPKSNQKLLKR